LALTTSQLSLRVDKTAGPVLAIKSVQTPVSWCSFIEQGILGTPPTNPPFIISTPLQDLKFLFLGAPPSQPAVRSAPPASSGPNPTGPGVCVCVCWGGWGGYVCLCLVFACVCASLPTCVRVRRCKQLWCVARCSRNSCFHGPAVVGMCAAYIVLSRSCCCSCSCYMCVHVCACSVSRDILCDPTLCRRKCCRGSF